MVIDPLLFFLALILLWFPRPWMRVGAVVGRRRRRHGEASWKLDPWNRQEPGDPRLSFRFEFTKLRNYFDLVRAGLGSLVIVGGLGIRPALSAAVGAPRLVNQEILGLKMVILLVAVLLQTLRYEHLRVTFFPPAFFIAGLSISLCGPWAALFSYVLVWAVSAMFNNAQGFMSVYALLLAAFGLLFHSVNFRFAPAVDYRLVIAAAVLCFLPVLLSLLTRRRLGVFTRKGAHVRMV